MCAAAFDFVAERGFIEASEDPNEVLDWMSDYGRRGRNAKAQGDDDAAAQFDELHQEAEDRVVVLKEARAARLAHRPPHEPVERAVKPSPPRPRADAPTEAGAARRADLRPEPVQSPERDDSAERADDRAAADRRRADEQELHQFAERARKAEARQKAAEAATARILAEQRRASDQQVAERRRAAKERAAKDVEDKERAAAAAEARTNAASQATVRATATAASEPAARGATGSPRRTSAGADLSRVSAGAVAPVAHPTGAAPAGTEALSPLARVFQERLIEMATHPAAGSRSASASNAGTSPSNPGPVTHASRPATTAPAKATAPPPPPAPVVDPDADLPPLTGADLTSFRTWLGASQRALAAKLGVEQSTISKGEGKPTNVLPPQLRRALHQAMGEPRADVGGAA